MDAFAPMGHYARPLPSGFAPQSLSLLAALAAFETLARLGWSHPVAVFDGGLATHWCWPAHAPHGLRALPTCEALTRLHTSLASGASPGDDTFAVALAPDARLRDAAVTLHVRLDDQLAVSVRCRDNHRADAASAVAELYAEILHDLLTAHAPCAFEARGLGAASRARVLGPLAGTRVDHGPFLPIPRAIEHRVDLHPARIAYRCRERTLTYGAFEALANGLAHELARAGVAHGHWVPVLIDHGVELPIAFLAIMKLGAAFVPLDPAWPAARLVETLERFRDAPILCRDASAIPRPFRAHARLVSSEDASRAPERQAAPLTPADVMYGIFTSGTTGRPRCALGLHGGLANRFAFMTRHFESTVPALGPVLQTSRPTFDSAVWQLLWPLTVGGEVVLPGRGDFLDLAATVALIGRHQVAMTDVVPSVLVQLVALAERDPHARERLASLRALVVGGEAIAPGAVHRLCEFLPDVRVWNAYGPTEASIGMVFHPVATRDGDAIPLGRPIDNCFVVVVDDDLRPLPPGAVGELLLGGACVGGGYLGDPEPTARAFVPNPFAGAIPGERLYRSGDLGAFDTAGRLRFAGRRDAQVKLAGVRIELGEIEAVAARHPAIRRARALVPIRHERPSLALCVAADGLEREALARHLAASLPRHSVPRHLLVLPELPVTTHGKVDVEQLRALLDADLEARARDQAPTPLHAQLLDLIAHSVGNTALDADDRVFHGGLDSLHAVALALDIARHFEVPFGPEELLDNPSARQLAARIEALRSPDAATSEPEAALMEQDARILARLEASPDARPRAAAAPARPPRSILLTGATGFIGSYLAQALLSVPDLTLYALCRARTLDLAATLRPKGLWREDFGPRLRVVHGDLDAPQLGLDAATYRHLAEHCDAIVHAGARVNLLFDYRAHRTTNVLGTAALADLAALERPKVFHHLSTLGIYERAAACASGPVPETVRCDGIAPPDSGYSRSKWVAERLLQDARRCGISVTLHRLGEVMPGTDGGPPHPRALTHLLLSAFVELGAVPEVPIVSDWSPVDWVAAAIVGAVLGPEAHRPAYHHVHPASVRFDAVLDRGGAPLPRLSARAWLLRLETRLREAPSPALATLAAFLPRAGDEEAARAAFAHMLSDNPRLFARREAAALGSALGLADPDVEAAIVAYAHRLTSPAPTDARPSRHRLVSRVEPR